MPTKLEMQEQIDIYEKQRETLAEDFNALREEIKDIRNTYQEKAQALYGAIADSGMKLAEEAEQVNEYKIELEKLIGRASAEIERIIGNMNTEYEQIQKIKADNQIEYLKQKELARELTDKQQELINEYQKLKTELDTISHEKSELKAIKDEYKLLIEILREQTKPQNERGAGRKPAINNELGEKILDMSNQGFSQRKIASELNLAVSTVNKYLQQANTNIT